jgi:hypothetical protein
VLVTDIAIAVAEITWAGTEIHIAATNATVVHNLATARTDFTRTRTAEFTGVTASSEKIDPLAATIGIGAPTNCAHHGRLEASRVAACAETVNLLPYTTACLAFLLFVKVISNVGAVICERRLTVSGRKASSVAARGENVQLVDPTALARFATVVADASAEVHLPTAFQAGIPGGSIARTSCALRLLVKPSRVAAPADFVDSLTGAATDVVHVGCALNQARCQLTWVGACRSTSILGAPD